MEFKITNPFVQLLLRNETLEIKRLHMLLDRILTVVGDVFADDISQFNSDERGMVFTAPFDEYVMHITRDLNTMSIAIVFTTANGKTHVASTYMTLIPEDGHTFLQTKYPLVDKTSKFFNRIFDMNNKIIDIDMASIVTYDDTPSEETPEDVVTSEEVVKETGDVDE